MISFFELGRYGRLGNQMFQIASTVGIADMNGYTAAFPQWYCGYTKKDMSTFFKNPLDHAIDHYGIVNTHCESAFHFTGFDVPDNSNLHGYFQTEKYFEHCDEKIRAMFEPSDEVRSRLLSNYGSYINNKTTCAIHVRRGDYVNNHVHTVCDQDYYDRAIAEIVKKHQIDKFLVFSDDIDWCRTVFPYNFLFVTGNDDVEDLFLMSMCSHNIISNSSFSWWASWLNNNPSKMVVAPNRWFGDGSGINDVDVYYKNMTKI